MAKVEIKKPIVDEIIENLNGAQAAVLVDYRGLTVEQDTQLRKQLREAGVVYKVYKNTYINFAIKGTEFESLSKYLEGPTAIAISKEDATAPARILYNFSKTAEALQLKAGVVDGVEYLLRERVNYTLVNYAANQYSNANADAGLKTLLSTLFKYGATAQQYFNYHNTEETLVTSNPLIASHYETYPPADVIALEDIDKMETTGSTHLDPNNKLFGYGRGLNCESTVEIYFGVKCLDFFNANPDADISKFTFVVSKLLATMKSSNKSICSCHFDSPPMS